MLDERLTTYSDIWAIGVITYFLLCGYTPFDRDSNLEEMQAILEADYSFPVDYWRGVSDTAKNFIAQCLTVDPNQRPTAHQALTHPWLKEDEVMDDATLKAPDIAPLQVLANPQGLKWSDFLGVLGIPGMLHDRSF